MDPTTFQDQRSSITSEESSQFSFELKNEDINTLSAKPHRSSPLRSPSSNSSFSQTIQYSSSQIPLASPTRLRARSPGPRMNAAQNKLSTPPVVVKAPSTLMGQVGQSSPSIVSSRQPGTPSSQLGKFEALVVENEELRNLLLQKDHYIHTLEQEITDLKDRVFGDENRKDKPTFEEKSSLSPYDAVHSPVPPPRSANRAKFAIPLIVTTQPIEETINVAVNQDAVETDQRSVTDDYLEDYNEETELEGDSTIQDLEPAAATASTPLSSNANIDWNAAVAALSISPEKIELHTPKIIDTSVDQPDRPELPVRKRLEYEEAQKMGASTKPSSSSTKIGLKLGAIGTGLIPPPTPPRKPQAEDIELGTPPLPSPDVPPMLSKSTLFTPTSGQNPSPKGPMSPERYPNSGYSSQTTASPQTFTSSIREPQEPLMLIEPTQLSTITPQIISTLAPPSKSSLKKKSSEPDFGIIIGLFDKSSKKEIWRIKKSLAQIKDLNDEIGRIVLAYGATEMLMIPDKSQFVSNTPQRVDARRLELDKYFRTLFFLPASQIPQAKVSQVQLLITRFISGDIVNLLDESNLNVLKHGWLLMKRLKGLKYHWKVKYCELDADAAIFRSDNGNGGFEQINLQNAQIGRQHESSSTQPAGNGEDDKSYRHAFIIMEAKKKSNGFNKHVFCAETDNERDIWVNFLIQAVDECSDQIHSANMKETDSTIYNESLDESLIAIQYNDSLKPAALPLTTKESLDEKEIKRAKKRSFFPFSKKQVATELESYKQQYQQSLSVPESSNIEKSLESMDISSEALSHDRVFANDLNHVYSLSSAELFDVNVPSIVSDCITYLLKNDALYEEGIFRLNGSSSLIKKLKAQFDDESDIDFDRLEPRPDINSIAGLLKLWFREIPGDVLPQEVTSQLERAKGAEKLSKWRDVLETAPKVNRNVMFTMLKFLSMIIAQQEYNKMNLKNLSIVFSPTFNISNDVLVELLVNHEYLFNGGEMRNEVKDSSVSNF